MRCVAVMTLVFALACGTTRGSETEPNSGGADSPVGALRNVLRLQQQSQLTEALGFVRESDQPLWVAMMYRTVSALVELSKAVTELSHGQVDQGATDAATSLAALSTKYQLPAVSNADPISSPDDYERDVRAVAGALAPARARELAAELATVLRNMSDGATPKPRDMEFEQHELDGDRALIAFKGAPSSLRWEVTRVRGRWYVNVESMLSVTLAAARGDNAARDH